MTELTQERLKECLHYDPDTGLFTWKIRTSNRIKIGEIAGYINPHNRGYVAIKFDGKLYYAHRLAWLYMTNEWINEIDHEDRNKSNNVWTNLRDVRSRQQNLFNQNIRIDNTTGYKGVYWHEIAQKWMASITHDYKQIYLGLFQTKEQAAQAYNKAAIQYHGDFACLNAFPLQLNKQPNIS